MNSLPLQLTACFVFLAFAGCTTNDLESLENVPFMDQHGKTITPVTADDTVNRVFFFLTYDCPLSINYSGPMNAMVDSFSNASVRFYYVFPGLVSDHDSVLVFSKTYLLNAPVIGDPEYLISKTLAATVTPQVVVLNRNGRRVYTGAFDNRAFETGKMRQVVTEHYVSDALKSLLNGKDPVITKTEPFGCYIEY